MIETLLRHDEQPVGESAAWRRLMETAGAIALSNAPVLIQGEHGSGKKVVARAVHAASPRRDHPFLVVDCGALNGERFEKELFGCDAGAEMGTPTMTNGLLAAAEDGTLFLEEIGKLSGAVQTSLLRVLDRPEYRPVGGGTMILPAHVRFIASSSTDLQRLALAGRLHDDLLYRINTIGLRVPPLRERLEDIPLLVQHFLRSLPRVDSPPRLLSAAAMQALLHHDWPGNVRELRTMVERLILRAQAKPSREIGLEDVRATLHQLD